MLAETTSRPGVRWRPAMNDGIAIAVVCAVVVMLYLRLPRQGDISDADATRHALDGAFVLDFLRAMPWRHPMEFAFDYYRQWPGLAIGFYPPMFAFVLAIGYAVFGVSEATALGAELALVGALGVGAYFLSRHWLDRLPALGAALVLIAAPELTYWGQQIMLDVPAYAFLIWAAEFQMRTLKGGSARWLYAAAAFAALAVCTKYNAIFFIAVMAIGLLQARGWRFLFNRTVLRAAALGLILLLPAVILFFKFASYDLEQAASLQGFMPRWSIQGLTYYARIMGPVISWPTLVLALLYGALVGFAPWARLPRNDAVFLLAWVILGYVFYTMISLKEPRHILFITYPLVLAAVLLLDRSLRRYPWRAAAPLALACGLFAFNLTERPVPYVTGMRQAAQEIARLAPPDTNVAFWGRLDGTFIYAMRAYTGRPDLGVVRLDKLLLNNVQIMLERGFTQKDWTTDEIIAQLRNLHVQYVVMQPRYANDLTEVQRLAEVLQSDKFQEVEQIPMNSNFPFRYVNELVIFRAVADVPRGRVAPPIEIGIIGKSI